LVLTINKWFERGYSLTESKVYSGVKDVLKRNVAFVGYEDEFSGDSNAWHEHVEYKEIGKMVTIETSGDNVKIKVIGIHRLWALKREILFRKENIIQVKIADKSLRPAPIRMPGTYIQDS
jgi:hypothetical protein